MTEGFAFDEADLAVNRSGKLTERQAGLVRIEMERRIKILAVLLAIGPALVTIAVILVVQATGGEIGLGVGTAFAIAYVITLLFILPTTALAVIGNYVRPLRNCTTGSATGRIKLTERGEDVHLQMGRIYSGPRFALGPEQAASLVDGERYTIYYTPGGRRSVFHSIEWAPELIDDEDSDDEDDDDNGHEGLGVDTGHEDGPES